MEVLFVLLHDSVSVRRLIYDRPYRLIRSLAGRASDLQVEGHVFDKVTENVFWGIYLCFTLLLFDASKYACTP